MNIKQLKNKSEKLQVELIKIHDKIAELEYKERNKPQQLQFIKIPEKKIEITKQVYNNKTYKEILSLLKPNERIADHQLLQDLRNNDKYRDLLGLNYCWAFVPNPDKLMVKKRTVAWFRASSDWADLDCDRDPAYSNSGLGVFIVRSLKK